MTTQSTSRTPHGTTRKREKFTEFELGFLAATASVARAGQDTLAAEMLGEMAIDSLSELIGRGLERFDRTPLLRVLRLAKGY